MKVTVNENLETLENIASISEVKTLDVSMPKKDHAKYSKLPRKRNKMPKFSDRFLVLSGELKDFYNGILDELLSYKKVKSRISERYNTIRLANTPLVRIALRKNAIRLYFNLEPTDYPKEFKLKDARTKIAFANFPTLLTLSSERSYQNALMLINELAGKFSLVQID